MVLHDSNPFTWKAEARGSRVRGQPRLHSKLFEATLRYRLEKHLLSVDKKDRKILMKLNLLCYTGHWQAQIPVFSWFLSELGCGGQRRPPALPQPPPCSVTPNPNSLAASKLLPISALRHLPPRFLIQRFGRREGTKREPDVLLSSAPASSLLGFLKPGALETRIRSPTNAVPTMPFRGSSRTGSLQEEE